MGFKGMYIRSTSILHTRIYDNTTVLLYDVTILLYEVTILLYDVTVLLYDVTKHGHFGFLPEIQLSCLF